MPVPKRIANKRDKDQMRVWSDDQHPPIIKDYDDQINTINNTLDSHFRIMQEQGLHLTMLNNHLKEEESDHTVIIGFDLQANMVYDGNLGQFAWNDQSWGDPNDDICLMSGLVKETDADFDDALFYPGTDDNIPGLYIFESVIQDWYEYVGTVVSYDVRLFDLDFRAETADGGGWVPVLDMQHVDISELSATAGIALYDVTAHGYPHKYLVDSVAKYGAGIRVFFRQYLKAPADPSLFTDGDRAKLTLRVQLAVNVPEYGLNGY